MDSTGLALTLAGLGVVLIAISYQRHLNRRDHSAMLHGISGALLFVSGALLLALSLNFNTYASLRPGEPLAELSIEESAAHTFQARLLRIPAGDLQVLVLQGDEWRVQARLLEWHGWPKWFGLTSSIRLEQLNSFDSKKTYASHTPYSSRYALSRDPGLSIWAWQETHPSLTRTLTTSTVLSDPMTLKHGLRFHLFLIDGKLIARQINTPTKPSEASNPSIPLETFTDEFNRQLQNSEASTEVKADSSSSPGVINPNNSPTVTGVIHSRP